MKTRPAIKNNDHRKGNKKNDFPEMQVGFPERNDAENPIDEMERVHVDLDTLDITRTNVEEFTREVTRQDDPSPEKKNK